MEPVILMAMAHPISPSTARAPMLRARRASCVCLPLHFLPLTDEWLFKAVIATLNPEQNDWGGLILVGERHDVFHMSDFLACIVFHERIRSTRSSSGELEAAVKPAVPAILLDV